MLGCRLAIFFVSVPVLGQHRVTEGLGKCCAERKADEHGAEAWIVSWGIFTRMSSVKNLMKCHSTLQYEQGCSGQAEDYSRVKGQRTDNVAQRICYERAGSIRGFLGVACDIRSTKCNALD